jgi:hypothetical protein
VLDLYDEYCHGRIDRREFLHRAGLLTVGGVSALAMAQAMLPRYALAQTISFTTSASRPATCPTRRRAARPAPAGPPPRASWPWTITFFKKHLA